jgi:hypothetical protein
LQNILRKENRIHPLGLHDGDNLGLRKDFSVKWVKEVMVREGSC